MYRVGGQFSEKWRRRLTAARPSAPSSEGEGKKLSWKRQLRIAAKVLHDSTWKQLYWPDFACLWARSAVRAAKELVRERGYDTMISVSHPFSSHWAGAAVKRKYPGLNWIVDVGDPFYFHTMPVNNVKLFGRINFRSELNILELADSVVVNTVKTKEKYMQTFRADTGKLTVSPPLLSAPPLFSPVGENRREGTLKLVFIGTLYPNIRSPDGLLQLFELLIREKMTRRLELHFYGKMDGCAASFDSYQLYRNRNLFVHGVVPREQVYEVMKDADVLVNIGNKTPELLPSKLVEYASTGKPVLNLISISEDSSAEFFAEYPAALTIEERLIFKGSAVLGDIVRFLSRVHDIKPEQLEKFLDQFSIEAISNHYQSLALRSVPEKQSAARAIHAREGKELGEFG
ncbi:glycosyltransferase [Paenibacillus sp. GYB003]|uniref:glycosyltransferase n=1 Tax=Paenibacillus sp. GYB003 TaxID=2994392 RepID=UPI002F965C65